MGYLSLIGNGRFARLWASQILSLIAQNLLNFALIIRVFDLAKGTPYANISVGLVFLSFLIPSVLFAAVAGVYVDHWDRRRVMVVSNAVRAVLVLGYLVLESNLAAVLLLTFLVAVMTQFFTPAEAASIPKLVKRKELLPANALFVFTFYAAFAAGYSSAPFALKLFGAHGSYWLVAGFFAMAALVASTLPRLAADVARRAFREVVARTMTELKANFSAIRADRNLYFPIIQLSVVQALIGVVVALGPALSLALLDQRLEDSAAVLIFPVGAGLVLGVGLAGWLAKRLPKIGLISAGLLIVGAILALVGRSVGQPPLVIAAMMFLLGLTNAVITVAAQTLLQEETTDATRGKVFGVLNMTINLAAGLPTLLAGILADVLGSVPRVIGGAGALVLLFAVTQAVLLARSTRQKAY